MKGKRFIAYLALLSLLIALFIPLTAAADGCPPENPNCNIEPPQSIEVNSDPLEADGSPVELDEPGALSPQIVPMPLPRVDPLPLDDTPSFEMLAIDMRYQDPADVSCGVQALGMAMSGLGEDAPSSDAILAFLEDRGMMYDFGTGVEELAYAAQSLGFEGSLPFHGWTLEDLQTELSEGRPVVVALGDDESAVGHFVTVTGISPDGQWIAFNDPTLGEQVIPTEEFLRQWSMQGNSGVSVRREAPAAGSPGYAPWVAFIAALMALISQTPLVLRRKGIGGSLEAGGGAGLGQPASGYHWVLREVPKYEWQEVQEGWQTVPKTVPNMVRRFQQVGWTTETERIPRYETVQVQDGWTYTYERVPTYRTVRFIRYWRTEYSYQATFRYIRGRRVFAGYKRVARRVPVYGTRRVFAGWQTQRKRVPNMVTRTVLAGYDLVEKRVPEYGWVEEQDGWTTESVQIPNMVREQLQVGTEWRWVQERVPQLHNLEFNLRGSNLPVGPQPDSDSPHAEATETPTPTPNATPEPNTTATPIPGPTEQLDGDDNERDTATQSGPTETPQPSGREGHTSTDTDYRMIVCATPPPGEACEPVGTTPINWVFDPSSLDPEVDGMTESYFAALPSLRGGHNVALERGTYIGDNPFSLGPSGVGNEQVEGLLGWLELLTGSGIIRDEAFGRYINTQEGNVNAELSYSQSDDGILIQQLQVNNESGFAITVSITIRHDGGREISFEPVLIRDERMGFLFSGTGDLEEWLREGSLIPQGESATMNLWIVANSTEPPLVRSISFSLPNDSDTTQH